MNQRIEQKYLFDGGKAPLPLKNNDVIMELENSDVLIAAEQTGSFAFWEDPAEDIYSLSDGVPL